MMHRLMKPRYLFAFVAMLAAVASLAHAGEYSRRYSSLERKPFLLGPTGIRACGPHSLYPEILASRGHTITSDFLVVSVDPAAPAEGLVRAYDIIIGANGARFKDGGDPRVDMGYAIMDSEGKDGHLRLTILRQGKELEVAVRIPPI